IDVLQVLHKYMPAVHKVPDNSYDQGKLYVASAAHLLADGTKNLKPSLLLVNIFSRMSAYAQHVQCNYHQQLKYAEQALSLSQALYPSSDKDENFNTARLLYKVGKAYHNLVKPQEALKYYEQALHIYPSHHDKRVSILASMGSAHYILYKDEEIAIHAYYRPALGLILAQYDCNDPDKIIFKAADTRK
ncbi:hypothetical protein GR268_44250, partial [Rhizobium leguminosarum]|nr:hypothetical protein [Rhizobium leguminosarum]